MKRILVIDPYAPQAIAEVLQKFYGPQVEAVGSFKDIDPDKLFAMERFPNLTDQTINWEADKGPKFDLFFLSSAMIKSKQIDPAELIKACGSENPRIVVMSSLHDYPKLYLQVPVFNFFKDPINPASGKEITSEVSAELLSFLN